MTSEIPAEFDNEAADIVDEEERGSTLGRQVLWVLIHCLIAIGSWALMMVAITFMHIDNVPPAITLALSFTVPFLAGNIFTRIKQNEMGPYTWLIGLIWFLIICLYILDMPTGPNQCFHCDASEKLYKTFLSLTEDSGLIDGEGRFIGTWPTVAFVAYGIGSGMALKRRQ